MSNWQKFFTVFTLVVISSNAFAIDQAKIAECKTLKHGVGVIMDARQAEWDIAELYEHFDYDADMIDIVNNAYAVPLFSTDKYKLRAKKKFQNRYFKACFEQTVNI